MLTVYGRASSSNVQALVWALGELGCDYERLDFGEKFGGLDTPEFRAMNPHGRIPVLVHDGIPLFETGAILRYVARVFGSEEFWPRDPLARAQVDQWAEWAKRHVAETFTGPVFWRVVRTPAARHDKPAIAKALAALEAELQRADAQLSGRPFLAGADLTLADIQFGHVLFRYFDIEIPRPSLPNVEDYYNRLTKRAAFQRAVMLPYDDLRNTL